MRWWHAAILLIVTTLIGLATGSRLFLVAALTLFVILAMGLVYLRLLGDVTGSRLTSSAVVPWGEVFGHRLLMRNETYLPIPSFRVLDETSLPEHAHGFVASMAPRSTVTWELGVPCVERGRYQIGPTTAHMSDPLGLFAVDRVIAGVMSVLVLPRWVPLQRSTLRLDGLMPGEVRSRHRGESPPAVAGLREYVVGDSLAAIHWPASVRSGKLVTKLFDPEVQTTLWLALDLEPRLEQEREELLVTAATSLGLYGLRRAGLRVGVLASGEVPLALGAERGRAQEVRLMEHLAEVRRGARSELLTMVRQRDRQFGPGHVVVLLTARGPEVWGSWLQHLRRTGVAPRVICVGNESLGWGTPCVTLPTQLGKPENAQALVHALEDGQIENA